MGASMDETHAVGLCSWVESANDGNTDFPVQNLPFARYRRAGAQEEFSIGVGIGDQILDIREAGLVSHSDMNRLMAASPAQRRELRLRLSRGLRAGSGQPFRRPHGQSRTTDAPAPIVDASRRLDYELELGFFVGPGNALGEPIPLQKAEDHLFGVGLLNDWSARDLQAWEYQPLGPFLSKNFATTVSPWVVTMEALAPFRAPFSRAELDPEPLAYLDAPGNREAGALDIELEVWLQTQRMRASGAAPQLLTRTNVREAAYWTPAQLVAHHTVNGCNLQPGDLFGSGTLSGPRAQQAGSLLELTQGSKQPLTLTNGETRTFLEDGDTVILRGHCQRAGAARIGFGEASGTVLGR